MCMIRNNSLLTLYSILMINLTQFEGKEFPSQDTKQSVDHLILTSADINIKLNTC